MSSLTVCDEIKRGNLLTHDPVGHWVDVIADDIASKPIGFKERSATTHEWISNLKALEVIGLEIDVT